MPYHTARLHLLLPQLPPSLPPAHPFERVNLDCVIVTRRRHLPCRIERRVADAQPALVLPAQRWQLGASPFTAQFPQIPNPHRSIQ